MPRIIFTADFNWHARPNVTIAYKAGNEYPVTQRCADQAIGKGKAKPVQRGAAKVESDASR